MSRLGAALRLLLGLGLLVALAWWLVPDAAALRAALARAELRPGWLALGLACTFVATLVTSARWQRLAEAMGGTPLPFVAYFHSLALTRVLGQISSTLVMDLVGRGVALRAAGSRRGLGHALTQAALERIFDLVLPLLVLAWALLARRAAWDDPLALAALVPVGLAFAALAALLLAPLTRLALRLHDLGAGLLARARAREPPPPAPAPAIDRRLALLVGLHSLARYVAVTLQFWAVALALGVDLRALQIAAATPFGQLAGMLGVTPGALGIQEAGWAGGLTWVGVPADAIVLFVVGQRLLLTAYFSLLSLASWPLLRRARATAA